ncbi:hypothetical protein [Kibdelosporangium aridum]|uniref:hypothetical protein n=1 Tax=Kibdelosporangium aridum TaxID=2030 RepID=UPI0021AE2360|nr:hypothetical protein [Kibdelosporangium aridum]
MQLAELLSRTGLDVLSHLSREVTVPVIDGLQAQGDLIVIPASFVPQIRLSWFNEREVPPGGVELVRGVAGNNPHTLVADPGTCRWTRGVHDSQGLGIAAFVNTAPVYLIHPEHGGTGVAPGTWVVRRQRESFNGSMGPSENFSFSGRTALVAD